MSEIHSTAIIEKGAELGEGTTVGAYSVIGKNVKIGKNNRIASHVVVEGYTTIGDENHIFQFASVGSQPQDLKYHGEKSELIIGDKNIVREYVTLQPGTDGGGGVTKIGNSNLFMASSHIGHDSTVGDGAIIANCAAISGHVEIGSKVTIGGLAGVHQFVRIGDYAFLGGGAMVTLDVPPFCTVHGDRAGLVGLNELGLQRAGFSEEEVQQIKKEFRGLFITKDKTFRERLASRLQNAVPGTPGHKFLTFISETQRGIVHLRKNSSS